MTIINNGRRIDEITQSYHADEGVAVIYTNKEDQTWGWEIKDNDGEIKAGLNGYGDESEALRSLVVQAIKSNT